MESKSLAYRGLTLHDVGRLTGHDEGESHKAILQVPASNFTTSLNLLPHTTAHLWLFVSFITCK